jgi:hypothetical protein
MPDTPMGAGDGDPLTRLEPAMNNQRLPGAQPTHQQRRRPDMAQRRGLGRQHLGWDEA